MLTAGETAAIGTGVVASEVGAFGSSLAVSAANNPAIYNRVNSVANNADILSFFQGVTKFGDGSPPTNIPSFIGYVLRETSEKSVKNTLGYMDKFEKNEK